MRWRAEGSWSEQERDIECPDNRGRDRWGHGGNGYYFGEDAMQARTCVGGVKSTGMMSFSLPNIVWMPLEFQLLP